MLLLFFVGKLFGGIKLVPKISPGKTVSGSLGGIILPLLLSLIFFFQIIRVLFS